MGIDVLGTLAIDGERPSPRERAILAALVVRIGTAASPDELAVAYWGDAMPTTWPKQIQSSIARLRKVLGSSAIDTTREGYALIVDDLDIDAIRFERLVGDAARLSAEGRPDRAADGLERALALWRGSPFPELPTWDPARAVAARLEEARRTAEEELMEARLDCAEHRSAVADLERLVREEPLRERRWVLLATALYRSGRAPDALAALRAMRSRLADDLGVDPGREVTELESAILRQDPRLDPPPPAEVQRADCPYKGLAAYGVDDAADFFGRVDLVRTVVEGVGRSTFLVVTGASGCGKSSLIAAGVVPELRRLGRECIVISPKGMPALRDATRRRTASGVLVVDQFEEVFTAGTAGAAGEYCRYLAGLVAGGWSVVLAVRSDYLDDCASDPAIGAMMPAAVVVVGPMSAEELRDAIREPARLAGLRMEHGLVELLVRDAQDGGGSLPLLSHALVETWLRREGATLTIGAYEAAGGIAGAIAQTAEEVYSSLTEAQRADCRAMFVRLFDRSPEGRAIRRRIPLHSLRGDPDLRAAVTTLVQARLLTAADDSVTVAHEALATAWPRLSDWLAEDADGAEHRVRLADATEAWQRSDEAEDDLLRGARLQAILEWRADHEPELTTTERRFLDASATRENAEHDALAARARHDRRQNRRLRALLVAAASLSVISVGATVLAVGGARDADAQRDRTAADALVSASLALRAADRDLAALLAVEAARRWPDDPRTRASLFGVFTASPAYLATTTIEGTDRIAGAVIPGSNHLVVVDGDGRAAVRELETGAVVRRLELEPREQAFGRPPLVAVSADGTTAAIARAVRSGSFAQTLGAADFGTVSELAVIDLRSGRAVVPSARVSVGAGALAIDATGRFAAIAAVGDERVRILDAETARIHAATAAPAATAPSRADEAGAPLAFLDDGRLVAGSAAPVLTVIDPATGATVERVTIPVASASHALAMASEARIVAVGAEQMIAVDLDSREVEWSRPRPAYGCRRLVASAPAERVFCQSDTGRIDWIELGTGAVIATDSAPRTGSVGIVDDRELVAIGAAEPVLRRWRLDGSGGITRTLPAVGGLSAGYEPNGVAVITGPDADSGYARLDTRSGDRIPIPGTVEHPPRWAGSDALLVDGDGDGGRNYELVDARSLVPTAGRPFLADATAIWPGASGASTFVRVGANTLVEFDVVTGERTAGPFAMDGSITSVSSDPDGSTLLVTSWVGGTSVMQLVDAESGRPTSTTVEGPTVAAFAGDREVIAAAGNRLVRYSLDDLTETGSLEGTSAEVRSLEVSEDGTTLLVIASDGALSLFDLTTGWRLGDAIQGTDPSSDGGMDGPRASLRGDGLELAVSRSDGVQLWDLDRGRQLEAACRVAGRDLTRAEWATHLGELGDWRSTCGFSDG